MSGLGYDTAKTMIQSGRVTYAVLRRALDLAGPRYAQEPSAVWPLLSKDEALRRLREQMPIEPKVAKPVDAPAPQLLLAVHVIQEAGLQAMLLAMRG